MLALLSLCLYGSYSDLKFGIIKNKVLAIYCVIGLLSNISWFFIINRSEIKFQAINIMVTIIVSLLLYVLHIWAGGDCKFIITLSLFVPFKLFVGLFNIPALCLIVFAVAFGFGFLYLIIDSIKCRVINNEKREKSLVKKKILYSIYNYFSCLVYIIGIDQILFHYFSRIFAEHIWLLFLINILVVFIVSGINLLKKVYFVCSVIVFDIAIKIIFREPILNRTMIINYLVVILFIVLRVLIDEYNYEVIETNDVKKGMILSLSTTLLFSKSKVSGLPQASTEDLRSRITEEEAQSVIRWGKSKYGLPNIEIVRKTPFAVFIALGAISFIVIGVVFS